MRKLATLLAATAIATPALAEDIVIYTGGAPTGKGSTYHQGFGQGVADFLAPIADELGLEITLVPTNGAVENANFLATSEDVIALGIGQGGLTYAAVEAGETLELRDDLPGECAMAFSAEQQISDWGDIVDNSAIITWVVPENSGSEAFIEKLYAEDANFVGAPTFSYASGSDNIVSKVANPDTRGMVGFFYAYANPQKGLVRTAHDADLNIFGVLSPDVAKTDSAYYLNRKAPYALSWLGFGETQTTRAMCSKALLFAAPTDSIDDPWMLDDAKRIHAALEQAPADAFVPSNGPLAKIMSTVEDLSDEYGISEMVTDLEAQIGQ